MVSAPMSGVSDEPFRLMLLKYGKPDVFWTEFVSVEGLFSKGRDYCLNLLRHDKNERPIVAQIFGADPANFERAAELIAELGFDGIDINMGCPDKDIEKQGAGAALIKNPQLAKEIIRAVKRGAPKLAISVKTRIGYSKNEIDKWILALLCEKIDALTVHFRTKKEMYLPPAHWELAKEIAKMRDELAKDTIILGNGDIKSLAQAKKLANETGLDGIMVGRAILGNPWFFSGKDPSVAERLEAIVEHIEIFSGQREESWESIKKHLHAYSKGFSGAKELRERLMKTKSAKEAKEIVERFLD